MIMLIVILLVVVLPFTIFYAFASSDPSACAVTITGVIIFPPRPFVNAVSRLSAKKGLNTEISARARPAHMGSAPACRQRRRDMLSHVPFRYSAVCFDGAAQALRLFCTATATATVAPTMGLLPMPRKPIISTCAGTEEEPANCASECMRPMVSVMP